MFRPFSWIHATCNFSVIAHIDHGKSTPGRSLPRGHRRSAGQGDGSAGARRHGPRAQVASRSRRIRSVCTGRQTMGRKYVLNLIDTPGRRRLLLRSDAVAGRLRRRAASGRCLAGVEAQTLANAYLAVDNSLEIISGHQQDRLAECAGRRSATAADRDRGPAWRVGHSGQRQDGNQRPRHSRKPSCTGFRRPPACRMRRSSADLRQLATRIAAS